MESGPAFPPELERELFETAALVHPATIPALLRVAKRVLLWIEPYLYRVIRMHRDNRAMVTAVLEAMKSKTQEFFRQAVLRVRGRFHTVRNDFRTRYHRNLTHRTLLPLPHNPHHSCATRRKAPLICYEHEVSVHGHWDGYDPEDQPGAHHPGEDRPAGVGGRAGD
ncbi:hypothetical protein B0H14DRAFT_3906143, partial [Mycena olivaceomarginata]